LIDGSRLGKSVSGFSKAPEAESGVAWAFRGIDNCDLVAFRRIQNYSESE